MARMEGVTIGSGMGTKDGWCSPVEEGNARETFLAAEGTAWLVSLPAKS